MREHSGGTPEVAFVPRGEEFSELHQVERPDMTQLDRPQDIILERLESGETLEDIVLDVCQKPILLLAAAAVRRAMGFVDESPKPRLTSDQIKWVTGISLFEGKTLGQLASRHGISKQAFQQGAEKLRGPLFGLRSQSARPHESRERMRLRNSRRTKHESAHLPA